MDRQEGGRVTKKRSRLAEEPDEIKSRKECLATATPTAEFAWKIEKTVSELAVEREKVAQREALVAQIQPGNAQCQPKIQPQEEREKVVAELADERVQAELRKARIAQIEANRVLTYAKTTQNQVESVQIQLDRVQRQAKSAQMQADRAQVQADRA